MLCIKCKKEINDNDPFCCWCGKKQAAKRQAPRHAKRTHQAGSIVKVKDGRKNPYLARLPADYSTGKPVRKLIGYFETYKEADCALREAMFNGEVSAKKNTLGAIYETFEKSNYFQSLSKEGKSSHQKAWKYLSMYGNRDVTKMSKVEFQEAADKMQKSGLKRETIAKMRNLASLLCKECMGMKLMAVNYGSLVQLPKNDTEQKQPFTNQQLIDVWKQAEDGNLNAMAIVLMCYTGMRPGELLGIQIQEHLKIADGMRYFITGSKTEAGRNRIIPIPESICPFLDQLISGRVEGHLIQTITGKKCELSNWRKRVFSPLMEKLNIEGVTPYTCRHTYADIQKRRNIDPEIMMEIMGHTDYSTTVENYHTTTENDIIRILNAAINLQSPYLMVS